jgi:hypothetical protein
MTIISAIATAKIPIIPSPITLSDAIKFSIIYSFHAGAVLLRLQYSLFVTLSSNFGLRPKLAYLQFVTLPANFGLRPKLAGDECAAFVTLR